MRISLYTAALGAALLLTASTAPVQAEVRDCAVDIKSLCAGIPPGGGHVLACLQSHISELSVGCSSILLQRLHFGPPRSAQRTSTISAPKLK